MTVEECHAYVRDDSPTERQEASQRARDFVGLSRERKWTLYEPVVLLKPELITESDGVRIDSFVKIEGGRGVFLGKCVHIASFSHINVGGGQVVIGDYAGISSSAQIVGGTNLPSGLSMSAAAPWDMQLIHRGRVVLEPFSLVGVGAIVMPDVTIGEGAVVAAGAVVTHDVPPWEIWAGVPARKLRDRPRPEPHQRGTRECDD